MFEVFEILEPCYFADMVIVENKGFQFDEMADVLYFLPPTIGTSI